MLTLNGAGELLLVAVSPRLERPTPRLRVGLVAGDLRGIGLAWLRK